jgi:hypothetical protein
VTFAAEEAGQILSQDALGRVLVSRVRRESLLEEYDRSGMSGVKFAQYVGIKSSTLAYWLQSRRRHRRREKFSESRRGDGAGKCTGGWIEAVVEEGSPPRVPAGALRIYFARGVVLVSWEHKAIEWVLSLRRQIVIPAFDCALLLTRGATR